MLIVACGNTREFIFRVSLFRWFHPTFKETQAEVGLLTRNAKYRVRRGSGEVMITRSTQFQLTFREPAWTLQPKNAPNGAKPRCRQTRVRSTTDQASVDRDARFLL